MRRLILTALALILLTCSSKVAIGQVYRNRLAQTTFVTVGDGHPSIALSSCPSGILSTSTSPFTLTGTSFDDVSISSVSCTNDKGGACTVSGTTSWSASVVLTADDTNTVTFTASDGTPPNATAVCAITYTTPDPTAPEVTVSSPAGDNSGFLTSQVFSGTSTDNVAVTSVQLRVNQGAWQNASGSVANWSKTIGYVVGLNTVEARALDEQGNTSPIVTRLYTRSVDIGSPTCSITGSYPLTTANTDVTINGTCTDTGGLVRIRVFPCDLAYKATINSSADSVFNGAASPTVNWSKVNSRIKLGTSTYCARGWDGDGNAGDSSPVTITFTRPTIIFTSELATPPARTGTAWSYDIYADGSDGEFTWDNGSGGTTFADSDCAGLSITEATDGVYQVGRISGTPTGSGTCTLTLRAVGGDATSDTWTAALTIQAGALTGPNEHFTSLSGLDSVIVSESLRDATSMSNVFSQQVTWSTSSTWARGRHSTDDFKLDQGRVRIGGTFTSGNWMAIYQMMWEPSMRSNQCRGGVFNAFQEGYNHKNINWRKDKTATPTNEYKIYYEQQIGFTDSAAADCLVIGHPGERFYHTPIVGGLPSNGSPNVPQCGNSIANEAYDLLPHVVYTFWRYIEIGLTESSFSEWEACTGLTVPSGTYDRVTTWVWGEFDASPTRIMWRVPSSYAGTPPFNALSDLNLEFDTSSHDGVIWGDGYLNIRNVVILRDYLIPATPEDDTTIFQRPRR